MLTVLLSHGRTGRACRCNGLPSMLLTRPGFHPLSCCFRYMLYEVFSTLLAEHAPAQPALAAAASGAK